MADEWQDTRERLESAGVVFVRGLSTSELRAVESQYRFRFPPDLASFLGHALPIGHHWPNWRSSGQEEALRLRQPFEGLCFDIEHNTCWLDVWGPRPGSRKERADIARAAVDAAPTLIPVVSHRYMPDAPHERDNPVLSVHQTDIIVYGHNLRAFFANHFPLAFGQTGFRQRSAKPIEFWSEFLR